MINKSLKGFSLVEIMIVVAIIALLAAIAIPNLMRSRSEANKTFARATLKQIATALENYSSIYSQYPSATSQLVGINPPYLNKDYFTGTYNGYTFVAGLSQFTYSVVAYPITLETGTTYTLATGGVITP